MSSGKYIVRQPIRDAKNKTIGYEILYYGENQAFGGDASGASNDFAAADTINHFLTENTDKVLRDSLNFMTFTTTLLMKKTPRLFDKADLVIQIDDSVIIHPLAMRMVQQYASEGYKVAVNEFRFAPRYLGQLDTIAYIKINFKTTQDPSLHNIIEIAHSLDKKCIATEIDSEALYQKALSAGVDALQGSYVAEKLSTKAHSSGYLKGNFFRLMVAVAREEPDVDEIEQIIAMDVSITFALLKVANSVYFALKHRATTIHQAVMTMGLSQLKQWVYLLGASDSGEELDAGTEEFMKRSFLRANFCSDLIRYAKDIPISKADAYLMGMFSTLGALIDAPLEDILSEIPILDEIKEALIHHTGRCGLLFELVLSYERADWNAITEVAEQLGIPGTILTSIYFNCMENVNSMWKQLTDPNPRHKEEAVGDESVTLKPGETLGGIKAPPPVPTPKPGTPVGQPRAEATEIQNRLSYTEPPAPQAPPKPKKTPRLPKFMTKSAEPAPVAQAAPVAPVHEEPIAQPVAPVQPAAPAFEESVVPAVPFFEEPPAVVVPPVADDIPSFADFNTAPVADDIPSFADFNTAPVADDFPSFADFNTAPVADDIPSFADFNTAPVADDFPSFADFNTAPVAQDLPSLEDFGVTPTSDPFAEFAAVEEPTGLTQELQTEETEEPFVPSDFLF